MGYIYGILNKLNGRWYIGQTRRADIKYRWFEHRTLNVCKSKQSKINRAMKKNGLQNFEFKIICICFDDALDEMEKLYVAKYDSFGPRGYNLTAGGRDAKRSKEYNTMQSKKFKIAGFHKGCRNPMHGRKHTDDAKKMISESSKVAVRQYTLANVFVAQFNCITDAAKIIREGAYPGHISRCCAGKRMSAYGFKWSWVPGGRKKGLEAKPLTPPMYCTQQGQRTPRDLGQVLRQYTLKNEFVAQYASIFEAKSKLGLGSSSHIGSCANGKRNSSHGFKWVWADESCKTGCEEQLALVRVLKQYTLMNEFVAFHESVKRACLSIGLDTNGHISSCCNGERKTAHGFKWVWGTRDSKDILSPAVVLKQYTLDDIFVAQFASITKASASLGKKCRIQTSSCCKGEVQTAHGFKWAWEEVNATNN